MLLGKVKKQPGETVRFTNDYAKVLKSTAFTSITPVVTPTGCAVSGVATNGTVVSGYISAGVDGVDGLVTIKATIVLADGSLVLEDEIRVNVKEVG